MSVVSGMVTFGVAGPTVVNFGITVNEIDSILGSRNATVEIDGLLSHGHADSGNQFCHLSKDGRAEKNATKFVSGYTPAAAKSVEVAVTGGWGTSMIAMNASTANASYPPSLIART